MALSDRRPPWLPPIQQQLCERSARTLQELLDAIGYFEAQQKDALPNTQPSPFAVLVVAPIVLPATLVLSRALTLTAVGMGVLRSDQATAIKVANLAGQVTLRHLRLEPNTNLGHPALVLEGSTTNVTVDRCSIRGGITCSGADAVSTYLQLLDNRVSGAINVAAARGTIRGNIAFGAMSITLNAGAGATQWNTVTGNHMALQAITSDLSAGGNVIDGNTQCGAITAHGTDVVGGGNS